MRKLLVLLTVVGCGGGSGATAPAAAGRVDPDASSVSVGGITVSRPDGYIFVEPDGSTTKDTVVVLHGPVGADLRPAIEVGRRDLTARDQQRSPSHLLTPMVTELMQFFEGAEGVTAPEDVTVSGQPAARVKATFTDTLPDGREVQRAAEIYGVVHGNSIWILRCFGAADGSDGDDCLRVADSLSFGS